jgi:hypothetical protein
MDTPRRLTDDPPVRLGLGANLAQFALLVGVNALVGGMADQERTTGPIAIPAPIAEPTFRSSS